MVWMVLDGRVNEVLSAVVRWNPSTLLRAYNACLSSGSFPIEWNTAKIVLLYKDHAKPVDQPSPCSPISPLDGTGKILKRLILNWVAHLVTESLSSNQYGFRPGRDTMEAIEAVLSRVANAIRGWSGADSCVSGSPLTSKTPLIRPHGRRLTQKLPE